MLGKLIGQEFKVTSRFFVPMYICLAVVTLLLKLTWTFTFGNGSIFYNSTQDNIMGLINMLLIMLYVIVLIGIVLLTYFIIIRRFYTNMFSDEGYLMFTLPVTTRQLINSKLIVAFIWQFLMLPATFLSFFVLFVNTDMLRVLPEAFSDLIRAISAWGVSGLHLGLLFTGVLVAGLCEMFAIILMCYLSITLGQHMWSEHRLLGSVLAFLGIYTIESLISSLGAYLVGTFIGERMPTAQDLLTYFDAMIPFAIIINVILIVVYYLITHYLLDKKLNLN